MVSEVMKEIYSCIDNNENFVLSGGAGSGKTHTLGQTLNYVFKSNKSAHVACITFTNVAADEIKNRFPYKNLLVATIHNFLWDQIKDYQKNLKDSLMTLIRQGKIKPNKQGEKKPNKNNNIDERSFEHVDYKNYQKLEKGIISHDDLLILANYMFSKYSLLSKILCDKFEYIFIDEYQDTKKEVIDIFFYLIPEHTKTQKTSLSFGLFGDKMQSIYDFGIGDIQDYIKKENRSISIREIKKEDNYRCSKKVIELLNKVRKDITQEPAQHNAEGSAVFLYSDEFQIEHFKESEYSSDWDFTNSKQTKVLFLTQKLNANILGFLDLLTAFHNNERLLGNNPDNLAQHLLKIGGIIYHFEHKNYSYVIEQMERTIENLNDKKDISSYLKKVVENKNWTVEKLIDDFNSEKIVLKDDKLKEYIASHENIFNRVKNISGNQVKAYFEYYNKYSPYSTQHGVKGAEFDNVLVVLDNGKWNKYNFKYYFEKTAGKKDIIDRTERVFYVACSRAKKNLVVFYPEPSAIILSVARNWFGHDNVHQI